MNYSYRRASIGFSLPAFSAGYKPANSPTNAQIRMPARTQSQGIRKLVLNKIATRFPPIIPRIIPKAAPIKLIIIDSNRN